MKTPFLLDVPKDSPSRKQRMEAFKAKHQIQTHSAGKTDDDLPKWMAGHLPSCRKLGYGCTATSDLFECAARVCRLMDEAGYVAYADTEREAILELCGNLDIPCDL